MQYIHIRSTDEEDAFHVAYNQTRIVQKFDSESLEIVLMQYSKGTGFFIESTRSGKAFESYLILAGCCQLSGTDTILHTGDLLIISELDEFLHVRMLEDTEILIHAAGTKVFAPTSSNVSSVNAILDRIQSKDAYTREHCGRVFDLVSKMAARLRFSGNRLFNLTFATRYHDLGKIHIEDELLNKPDKLTTEEYSRMKEHVLLGKEMILHDFNEEIFRIIVQHHERMNGSGYPYGLSGDEISEDGRLIAICDSYDAMVTDRVYKRGKTPEEALQELRDLSGTLFDSRLVEAFIAMMQEDDM